MSLSLPEVHAGIEGVLTALPPVTTENPSPTAQTLPIVSWNATKTTKFANTTCTANYDSTNKVAWDTSIPTTTSMSGSATVEFDANNAPYGYLETGTKVTLDVTAVTGKGFSGDVWVDSLEITSGGNEDTVKASFNWHSEGAITWK